MQDNSPMEELQTWISTWLDPRLVGEVVVAWSGRLLAALAIFIVGRLFLRALIALGRAARCAASASTTR